MLALTLLTDCAIGPDYRRPQTPAPEFFSAQNRGNNDTFTVVGDPAPVLAEWWKAFHDAELDRLVSMTLTGNLDLQSASARIVQARAELKAANAGLFPSFSAKGSDQRYRVPDSVRDLPQSAANNVSPATGAAIGASGFTLPGYISLYQANFDASWEPDIWGGTRRSIEAAHSSVQAAYYARRGVVVSTLAELGNDYASLRATQARIVIAARALDTDQQLVDLTQNRQQNGLASDLDVAQAQAQLENTRALLPPLQAQLLQRIHAIAILTGQLPETLEEELGAAGPTLSTPPSIPMGLPSTVLLNRPDVQQADRTYAAANAQIGVAEAQRLPSISLTGAAGSTSTALDDLLKHASWTWNAGTSITAPLFDFGRLQANQRAAEAAAQEQALKYQKTVLQAFQDVEDSLQSYASAKRQRDALNAALTAGQLELSRATDQYRAGLASYINVLDADRSLTNAQDQKEQSEQMQIQSLIGVYKALGGGWQAGDAQLSLQLKFDAALRGARQSFVKADSRER